MAQDEEGNIYVSNPKFSNPTYPAVILRVNIRDGRALGVDVVVTGHKHPNALRWHEGALYVTDTKWEVEDSARTSGLFHIPLPEMRGGNCVTMQPSTEEPHRVTTFEAIRQPNGKAVGTNGLCFVNGGFVNSGDDPVHTMTIIEVPAEFLTRPVPSEAGGGVWDVPACEVIGEGLVVVRPLEDMAYVCRFVLLHLGAIWTVASKVLDQQVVIVPVRGINRHVAVPVVVLPQNLPESLDLGLGVAFLQVRKAEEPCVRRRCRDDTIGPHQLSFELRDAERWLVKIWVRPGVIGNPVALYGPRS